MCPRKAFPKIARLQKKRKKKKNPLQHLASFGALLCQEKKEEPEKRKKKEKMCVPSTGIEPVTFRYMIFPITAERDSQLHHKGIIFS